MATGGGLIASYPQAGISTTPEHTHVPGSSVVDTVETRELAPTEVVPLSDEICVPLKSSVPTEKPMLDPDLAM
jgi:hypothetical protein